MPRKETYAGPISAQAQQDLVSEGIENFELPKSVVTKIAKSAIPDNIKLQKETVLSLVKGSTVFINYLAATAHDVALSKQHKSISASDVLRALELMEFSDMVNKLQSELNIYRDVSKNDKGKKSGNGHSASAATSSNKKSTTATTNTSVTAPPGGTTSISAPVPKAKGKEKATNPLPGPFTSAPLGFASVAPSSISGSLPVATDDAMEVDEDKSVSVIGGAVLRTDEGDDRMDEEVEEEEEDDDDEEIVDEDEEDVDEEIQDVVTLEEEELKKDAKGVDDAPLGPLGDDD